MIFFFFSTVMAKSGDNQTIPCYFKQVKGCHNFAAARIIAYTFLLKAWGVIHTICYIPMTINPTEESNSTSGNYARYIPTAEYFHY